MARYDPPHATQFDGSACASGNCVCASTKMAVMRDWFGGKTPSISAIRNYIEAHHVIAHCSGTAISWNAEAALALYGSTLTQFFNAIGTTNWNLFNSGIVDGRGAVVFIKSSVLAGTEFANGFSGHHGIYVNERRYNSSTLKYEFLVHDPIKTKGAWWPSYLLKQGMDAHGLYEGMFTRDTVGYAQKVICSGAYLYASTSVTSEKTAIAQGTAIVCTTGHHGGAWSFLTCSAQGASSGDEYVEVTEVAGIAMATHWPGHTVAYIPRGKVFAP